MSMMPGTWPGSAAKSMPWLRVKVESIQTELGYAMVRDEFGVTHDIPLHQRSRGMLPAVGEKWIIDRSQGMWNFALCILPKPPVITGSTDGIPALRSLIDQLAAAGLIDDQTTEDRIRATHPHTHTDPQGGSVGPDSL